MDAEGAMVPWPPPFASSFLSRLLFDFRFGAFTGGSAAAAPPSAGLSAS